MPEDSRAAEIGRAWNAEHTREPGLFKLEKRRLRGIQSVTTSREGYREDRARSFSEVHSEKTRSYKHKLQEKFYLDIRKSFFTVGAVCLGRV